MAAAGALDAQAPTVAVLGGGVDVVYPKVHKKLYNNILKDGFVLSEYPPGASADGNHFPKRNRLISGLARCTLVIEGDERSGSLITARDAIRQGRPLFALPGPLCTPNAEGTNELIKSGKARMVTVVDDIIEAFNQSAFPDLDINAIGEMRYDSKKAASRYGVESKKDNRKKVIINQNQYNDEDYSEPAYVSGFESEQKEEKKEFATLSVPEKQIYDCIPEQGDVGMDLIVAATGQSVSDVTMHLLSLALKSAVVEMPGNRYRRT